MSMRNANLAWSIAAVLAMPASASAADRSHRCAEQIDDAQRLACYDAEYGKPDKGGAGGAAARTPVVQPPQAVAPAAVAANKPNVPRSASPAKSTASVKALGLLHDGRFKATLDNGEVWAQLEPDKAAVLAVGNTVTIKKAVLGSFQLVTPAGVVTRVKQVQ